MDHLKLLPQKSPLFESPIFFSSETDSTMNDARELSPADAPTGTLVLTAYQRAGKGRREGRVWHAEPNQSLMLTLVLRDQEHPHVQSLRMAAAVVELLRDTWAADARIKWPNDILVRDRKICGILPDLSGGVLTIGVGLNLCQTAFPAEIADRATSVRLLSGAAPVPAHVDFSMSAAELAIALVSRFVSVAKRWRSVLDERLYARGRSVRVTHVTNGVVTGTLTGVDGDGRLLVENEKIHQLAAGEVSLITA